MRIMIYISTVTPNYTEMNQFDIDRYK